MPDLRTERCEYCDDGWVEGYPMPTPDGPHYPMSRCNACNRGWVEIELEPITEHDIMDIEEALRLDDEKLIAMGVYEPVTPWRGGCGAIDCVNGCDGAPDFCEAALSAIPKAGTSDAELSPGRPSQSALSKDTPA